MNSLKRLFHLEGLKRKIKEFLGININEIKEEIKDRILFELSFFDLKKQEPSKLFYCTLLFFHTKKPDSARCVNKFYKANSEFEAYGAFIDYLKEIDVTPEKIVSKWDPIVYEITSDSFVDVRKSESEDKEEEDA